MKRLVVSVCAVASVLLAAGCSSGATASTKSSSPPQKGTIAAGQTATSDQVQLTSDQEASVKSASKGALIGIVCATMNTQFHATLCNAAKDRAEALGYKAEIFDSQTDPNRELQGLEGFISKGAVAILEDSLGGDAIVNEVQQATNKGIVVVQLTSRDYSKQGAITVSVDDAEIAKAEGDAAGKYAAAHYAGQTVQVAVTDYPSIPSLVQRADDIIAAFKAQDPQMNVVGRYLGGTPENGQKSIETALQRFPGIQAVIGINDAGNLGAYQALKAAGHTGQNTFIFGIDCDPQAVDLIKSNTMYKGCVDTNPKGTGELAVDAFALYQLGKTVPGDISVPVSVFQG
jgi:ribose transport system substrate-binding protein